MITTYNIRRVSKNIYIVQTQYAIVKECKSFKEAQDYIFIAQSNELMEVA